MQLEDLNMEMHVCILEYLTLSEIAHLEIASNRSFLAALRECIKHASLPDTTRLVTLHSISSLGADKAQSLAIAQGKKIEFPYISGFSSRVKVEPVQITSSSSTITPILPFSISSTSTTIPPTYPTHPYTRTKLISYNIPVEWFTKRSVSLPNLTIRGPLSLQRPTPVLILADPELPGGPDSVVVLQLKGLKPKKLNLQYISRLSLTKLLLLWKDNIEALQLTGIEKLHWDDLKPLKDSDKLLLLSLEACGLWDDDERSIAKMKQMLPKSLESLSFHACGPRTGLMSALPEKIGKLSISGYSWGCVDEVVMHLNEEEADDYVEVIDMLIEKRIDFQNIPASLKHLSLVEIDLRNEDLEKFPDDHSIELLGFNDADMYSPDFMDGEMEEYIYPSPQAVISLLRHTPHPLKVYGLRNIDFSTANLGKLNCEFTEGCCCCEDSYLTLLSNRVCACGVFHQFPIDDSGYDDDSDSHIGNDIYGHASDEEDESVVDDHDDDGDDDEEKDDVTADPDDDVPVLVQFNRIE